MKKSATLAFATFLLLIIWSPCLSQLKLDINSTYGINFLESKVNFDTGHQISERKIKKSIISFGASYHWTKLVQLNLDIGFGDYYIGYCDTHDRVDASGMVRKIKICRDTDYTGFTKVQSGVSLKLNTNKLIQLLPSFGIGYSFYKKAPHPQEGAIIYRIPDGKTTYVAKDATIETLKNIVHINLGLNVKFKLFQFLNFLIKTSYNLGISSIVTHNIRYSHNTPAIENITTLEEVFMNVNPDYLLEKANVSTKFSGYNIALGFEVPLKFKK